MALNFSASFAACLAAGLKVPRQFMYCIAQDPGPPYVVYKDSGGTGGASSGGGGMMGPPPNSEWAEHFANSSPTAPPTSAPNSHESPQHQQNLHNNQQQQQQQHAGSPSPPYPQQQHTPANSLSVSVDDGSDGAAGAETAASSHESTGASQDELACPELPTTPAPPQQHYYGSGNNVGSSGGGSGAAGGAGGAGGGGTAGGGGGGGGGGSSGGGSAAGSGGGSGASSHGGGGGGGGGGTQTGSGGGSGASTGSGGSSAGGGNTRVPSHPHPQHMISPTAFMSYLKQPVVLTSLNSSELAEFHSGMPELLSGGLKGMSGNSSVNGQGKNCELRLFKCLTCGKDFKQKSTLLQHERIHTDSRPYGCTECGKRFRQQSHLTQHLRIHANEKPFACVYCERTFRQRAILNQHLRIHSDVSPHLVYKNGQLWPQDVPFPGETNKEALMNLTQHGGSQYENQGSQGEANGQCFSPDGSVNQFPAYFKDAKGVAHGVLGPTKGLPELLQSGRQAGMPLYVRCPICQKEFKQKSTLLQHGCIHIESRPYPCVECGKRFRQQSHLTQHLRIHTNEKPYGCLYCGRNFRQRTILNQHVRAGRTNLQHKIVVIDEEEGVRYEENTETLQLSELINRARNNACRLEFKNIFVHMNSHKQKL